MKRLRVRAERGISLIFALLALVALTLGAVALLRSVDTGVMVLGNLSYRQSGVAASSRGAEDAIAWLSPRTNDAILQADAPANGYYASAFETLDPTARAAGSALLLARVDWDDDGCDVNGTAVASAQCITAAPERTYGQERVRYVITRLCPSAGVASTLACARPPIPPKILPSDRGGAEVFAASRSVVTEDLSPYYRIIVRTQGPRGTVTFTETLVHF